MKTGTPTAIVLALLLQAAASVHALPCSVMHVGDTAAPDTELSVAAPVHADHAAMHGGDHPSATESADPGPRDCCGSMSPIACASGGCIVNTGTLLTAPQLRPLPVRVWTELERTPEWLPSYGAPAPAIFRPPIA